MPGGRTWTEDLAWLAGILEGEGCFRRDAYPFVTLQMTDRDVVERAAILMLAPKVHTETRTGRKPLYRAQVGGAKAIRLMRLLLRFMGQRRTARIQAILTVHAERQRRKLFCRRGHRLTARNVAVPKTGWRRCRTCLAAANRAYRSRQKAAA